MISIKRHTADQLVIRFKKFSGDYGFNQEATGEVIMHNMPFAVGGGYLQIFGPLVVVISMDEVKSIAFVPGEDRPENIIGIE